MCQLERQTLYIDCSVTGKFLNSDYLSDWHSVRHVSLSPILPGVRSIVFTCDITCTVYFYLDFPVEKSCDSTEE